MHVKTTFPLSALQLMYNATCRSDNIRMMTNKLMIFIVHQYHTPRSPIAQKFSSGIVSLIQIRVLKTVSGLHHQDIPVVF